MDNGAKIVLLALLGLTLGFCIGFYVRPDPVVEIKAMLKPPFVEVIVNGKVYDAKHLNLAPVPEKKKGGWWSEEKPISAIIYDQDVLNVNGRHMTNLISLVDERGIAANCQCGENCNCADCSCQKSTPVFLTAFQQEQRTDNRGNQNDLLFGGIKEIVKELMAWMSGKGDDVAKAMAERERALSEKAQWTAGVTIVCMLLLIAPLWMINGNLARIANKP